MDIEGYELDALPEWIESGALEKVFQFSGILFPWKRYFNFLAHLISLEKVFKFSGILFVWFPGKVIFESKGEYLPGGPVGYGASS